MEEREVIPCSRCHRTLKNEKSIEIGMGRSCYKKYLREITPKIKNANSVVAELAQCK